MKKTMKWISVLLTGFLLLGSAMSCGKGPDEGGETLPPERPTDYAPTPQETVAHLAATDAYGRSFGRVDGFDSKKKVGLFYFLWSGRHGSAGQDISKQTLDEIKSATNIGMHHYWGEPLYGYYDSEDPWVMRRHLELFMMAGVDYLVLDTTNGLYWETQPGCDYRPAIFTLLELTLELRAQGWNPPQLMFYTNTDSKTTVQRIYDAFYDTDNKPELRKYAPLWFNFADTNNKNRDKKPWIVARNDGNGANGYQPAQNFDALPQTVRDAFYLKDAQWPNDAAGNKDNGFPWMSWTKADGRYEQYNHDGMMSVSIAQHVSGAFSDSVLMNGRDLNFGRGFSRSDGRNVTERIETGSNFQDQWDYAILQGDGVNNVFITGWNEWVAQKQPAGGGRNTSYFVDLFNEEYSRDAEMMKGGYGDAFFVQIADNIRRFKGLDAPGLRRSPWPTTIDLDGDLEQWEGTRGYLDPTGDTADRDFASANRSLPHYTDDSGRNDIASVRITYDDDNLYFLIACAAEITPYEGGENWMNLLLSCADAAGGWEGYHYVVNRSVSGAVGSVERLSADGSSVRIGDANLHRNGQYLAVSVPRSAVGLSGEELSFSFKVADHVTHPRDIADYYATGDAAPLGRLNYSFRTK